MSYEPRAMNWHLWCLTMSYELRAMSLMPSGHQIQLRLVDYIGKVNLTYSYHSVFV